MSDTVLTIIGSIVGVAAVGVMVAVVVYFWKMASKAQASSTDRFAQSAKVQGWQFEHTAKMGDVRMKWSGSSDGVGWVASHTRLSNDSVDHFYTSNTFRWRAEIENGPASPLILTHERSNLDGVDEKLKKLPGFLRGIASVAIDHVPSAYFGPEAADVDLSKWVAVEGHKIPDMRVLAPVDDPSAFRLAGKVAPAIISESAALAAGSKPPVILIKDEAVHLATTTDITAADLERAVRLGVGIVKALAPR